MYTPRLKILFRENILPTIKEEFSYNQMQVPILQKIILSRGVGEAISDKKIIDVFQKELSHISGQKAVICYSKKDIANFKLRKGLPIGVKVTLRRDMMYEFLDRFISSALPRVRDFRGLESSKGFDGRGNYSLGISELIIFHEINIDAIVKISGLNVNFVTSASSDDEARGLLEKFGMPFKKK